MTGHMSFIDKAIKALNKYNVGLLLKDLATLQPGTSYET